MVTPKNLSLTHSQILLSHQEADVYLKPTRKKEIKKRNETHDIDCDIEKTTEAFPDQRKWINLGKTSDKRAFRVLEFSYLHRYINI